MSDDYVPTHKQLPAGWKGPGLQEHREHGLLGYRLLGRYEVFGMRQGGFGIVYWAEDVETRQKYAIKTYKPEYKDHLPSVEEFKSEVDFWINLDPHPNIVKAHSVVVEAGQPYLLLELVSGPVHTTLRDWMVSGPLNNNLVVKLAYDLCLGMEFANRKGEVAHLDLKPENLLLDEEEVLKVADFGLARRVRLTQKSYPRVHCGSWPYAPPERFADQAEDCRSDVFAFGVIVYEMLTGELPYPFKPSKAPGDCERQFRKFHAAGGMRGVTKRLYYQGVPGAPGDRLGVLLSMCVDNYQAERCRSFRELRQEWEEAFHLEPPEKTPVAISTDEDLYSRALSMYRLGKLGKSLTLFNLLLQRRSDDGQLWFDAARVLLAAGQDRHACEFARKAVRLKPSLRDSAREFLT